MSFDEIDMKFGLVQGGGDIYELLYSYPIVLSNGEMVPLSELADVQPQAGFEQIRHYQGRRVVTVLADVVGKGQ